MSSNNRGKPETISSRRRILFIINLLVSETNQENGLTVKEIIECLLRKTGCTASVNAVLADLHAIACEKPMGIELQIPKRGETGGFKCVSKPITTDEALILSNLVTTSSFLDSRQRISLQDKLELYISKDRALETLETVVVDERETYSASELFQTLSICSRAIKENEVLMFRYATHFVNGSTSLSTATEENPISIVLSNGKYYLASLPQSSDRTESNECNYWRMERMRSVISTGKRISEIEKVAELRKKMPRIVKCKIDMFGKGAARRLFLKVKGKSATYAYDRFGHDLSFFATDDTKGIGYMNINVQLSPTLYRWLFGMGGDITLVNPKMRFHGQELWKWAGIAENEISQIAIDYQNAMQEFRKQIKIVTNAYEWELEDEA